MANFNTHNLYKNAYQLTGSFARKGYDWWWHNFTGRNEKTGEEKSFFIEYFMVNPAAGGNEPVFGQLESNRKKGIKPSYLMVKAGAWGKDGAQLHRFFGWNKVTVNKKGSYTVAAEDCFASETELKGKISISKEESQNHPEWMCDCGEMEWNLTFKKDIAWNVGYGTSALLRKMKAFEMYWHAEGMKSFVSGTVIFNGEKYIIEEQSSYGYADKNWGSNFTSPWVWLSSWNMVSEITGKKLENSVFDCGGGRPKIYFLPLNRKLLSAFWYEGKAYEFNFSKFWTFCKTDFKCNETESQIIWHVKQSTLKATVEYDIVCDKEKMLLVNYEAPDGKKRHNRLWNGGNGYGTVTLYKGRGKHKQLIDKIKVENVGCEYGEYC